MKKELIISSEKPRLMRVFLFAEQALGSDMIDIHLSNGQTIKVKEEDVISFILKNELNKTTSYINIGGGEPWFDVEQETAIDPALYLENNFDATCKLYFDSELNKSTTLDFINDKISALDLEDKEAMRVGDIDKSITITSIKLALMDVRIELGRELGYIREAV